MENLIGWDLEKDLSRTREFNVNDRDFILKAHDPYGFWTISLPKGKVPKQLSGQYTSPAEAEKAIVAYLNKPPKAVEEMEEGIRD